MKKYFLSFLLAVVLLQGKAQTVTILPLPDSICAGTTLAVYYTTSALFTAGNVFTAQISDAAGSFSQPITIGNAFSSDTGDVLATIPQTLPAGTGYRIRMVSSIPVTTSADNGVNLTIKAIPAAPVLTASGSGCAMHDSLTISGANGAEQYNWIGYNGITTQHGAYRGTIIAGGNDTGTLANQLNNPTGLYVDNTGNLYVSDGANNRVMKFAAGSTQASNGVVVAGGNGAGSAANQFNFAGNMFVDGNGNLYVADVNNNRVQMFAPGSTQATAGVTVAGGNGAGNAANQLNLPTALYVDGTGNIYVVDYLNNRVQKFAAGSTSATNATTVAGGNGAGGAANQLDYPEAVYLDGNGNIYVADYFYSRIQKFPAGSTSATNAVTVAGGNFAGAGDNQLNGPFGLCIDAAGNIFVADYYNQRIIKFPAGGNRATQGTTVVSGVSPSEVFVDGAGTIYVTDLGNNSVEKFTPGVPDSSYVPTNASSYWATYTLGGCASHTSDTVTVLPNTTFVSVAPYINTICPGTVDSFYTNAYNGGTNPTYQWYINSTLAGGNTATFQTSALNAGDSVKVKITSNAVCAVGTTHTAATTVTVNATPPAPTVLQKGHCLFYDTLVLHADTARGVTWYNDGTPVYASVDAYTVAGGHGLGNAPDQINDGIGIFIDHAGSLYIAEYGGARVVKFPPHSTPDSASVTVAMNGYNGGSGIWIDNNDNLYVSDIFNNVVLKYPAGGDSTTPGVIVAGRPGAGGGNSAGLLFQPAGLYMDAAGYLYVADAGNARVQRFAPGSDSTTNAVTVAQNGLSAPVSIYKDSAGYLFVADQSLNIIKKYSPNSNASSAGITIGAGQLNMAAGVVLDKAGNIFVADNNHVVKFPHNSVANTIGKVVAGGPQTGSSFTELNAGDGGIFLDSTGNIYVCDRYNNRVQKFVTGKPDTTYIVGAAGSYTATFVSPEGCTSAWSNTIIIGAGATPVITQVGDTLSTSTFPGYQWLNNGVADQNATAESFVANHTGSYSVVITEADGCKDTSAAITITFAGVNNMGEAGNLKVYPNPNTGTFILETDNCTGNEFIVTDMAGKTIFSQKISTNKQAVSMNHLAAGTYLLKIGGTENIVLKFTVN